MPVRSAPPTASGHLLKHLTLIVVALALLIVVAVGAMAVGRAMLSPGTVVDALWQLVTGDGDTPPLSLATSCSTSACPAWWQPP